MARKVRGRLVRPGDVLGSAWSYPLGSFSCPCKEAATFWRATVEPAEPYCTLNTTASLRWPPGSNASTRCLPRAIGHEAL